MIPCCCSLLVPPSTSSIAKFISDQPCLQMLETQCSNMSDLQMLHAQLIKTGLINDFVAASRVLSFSASPRGGNINYAYTVFTRIQNPNPFAWNTIIRAFSNSSTPETAISLFVDMLVSSEVEPRRLTYPPLFKAYARLGQARNGSQLHGRILKLGLERDEFVRNSLIHMYANSGLLLEARQVFDESPEPPDVVAWNSLISGLSKSGQVKESRRMFDIAPERSSVTWSSMISGYVRNGRFSEALELFGEMQAAGAEPSEFTMVSLLNASGRLGAVTQGEWVHEYIVKKGFEMNVIVVTAIVDMYGKCGSVEKALRVFETAPNSGLSCWNSMIMGFAINGRERDAVELFTALESSNYRPDDVSFLSVLTACQHAGMVDKARGFFLSMTEKYGIEPSIRHYGCMVGVLGRAGLLGEAVGLISSMPVKPDAVIWGSLLSACERHGNVEVGELAADRLAELDPRESSAYVLMSNVYAGSDRFEDAVRRRLYMKENRVEKEPGCSLIEVDGEVHEFVALGRTHPRAREIYALLNESRSE